MQLTRKTLAVALSLALVATMLVACKQSAPRPPEPSEPASNSTTDTTPEPSNKTNTNTGLSDDPYSFTVSLDGVVYELPAAWSEFAEDGWALPEGAEGETLEPNGYTLSDPVKKGKEQVYMSFVNNTMDVQPFDKCAVGKITLDSFDFKNGGAQLVFPGEVTIGSTRDEVIAAYGEPTDSNPSDSFETLTYEQDTYAEITIQIDAATKTVSKLDMQNLISSEKPESGGSSDASSSSVSEASGSYQAPSSLGSGWDSFTAKYGGTLYKVPAPVSEFIKNGWEIVSGQDTTVPARQTLIGFDIRLDNQVLHTNLYNYDSTAQPAENCFVTKIEYYDLGAQVSIELPGGITEASSIDQVIAAYGQPAETDESASFRSYTWGTVFESVEVIVSKETNRINHITVEHRPKQL